MTIFGNLKIFRREAHLDEHCPDKAKAASSNLAPPTNLTTINMGCGVWWACTSLLQSERGIRFPRGPPFFRYNKDIRAIGAVEAQ